MHIFRLIVPLAMALNLGCAATSGVVSAGGDKFVVSRQSITTFSRDALKADVIEEASSYCKSKNKELVIISTSVALAPFMWGNFWKAEVQFRCVVALSD